MIFWSSWTWHDLTISDSTAKLATSSIGDSSQHVVKICQLIFPLPLPFTRSGKSSSLQLPRPRWIHVKSLTSDTLRRWPQTPIETNHNPGAFFPKWIVSWMISMVRSTRSQTVNQNGAVSSVARKNANMNKHDSKSCQSEGKYLCNAISQFISVGFPPVPPPPWSSCIFQYASTGFCLDGIWLGSSHPAATGSIRKLCQPDQFSSRGAVLFNWGAFPNSFLRSENGGFHKWGTPKWMV